MTVKVFHTADLHLSQSERNYGFAVLEELVYHCRRLQADAWVFCGDVFDSFEDFAALSGDFAGHIKDVGEVPVLLIPGNHELSGGRTPADLAEACEAAGWNRRGSKDASPPPRLLTGEPMELAVFDHLDAEFLGVPFRRGYADYIDWRPPPRERRWRVGLLHGVVNGLTYTGESEEDEQAVIDPDLFSRLDLSYAALGHIHGGRESRLGDCLAHYPGSARVWRKGETGPRRASLVVLDEEGARLEPVELKEAGVYRECTVPLDDEGALLQHDEPEALLDSLRRDHGPADWLQLELTGFVEGREPVEALARKLKRQAKGAFRRFDVGLEGVVEAQALRGHPLARAFDAGWRTRHREALAAGDDAEAALLVRARRMALEELHARLAEF